MQCQLSTSLIISVKIKTIKTKDILVITCDDYIRVFGLKSSLFHVASLSILARPEILSPFSLGFDPNPPSFTQSSLSYHPYRNQGLEIEYT
jgi:hypothetical protein